MWAVCDMNKYESSNKSMEGVNLKTDKEIRNKIKLIAYDKEGNYVDSISSADLEVLAYFRKDFSDCVIDEEVEK